MTLIDAATAKGLKFVLAHHETSALFMAAAEAELTGVPGVCLATVGPGLANAVNGLAHCSLDRVPLLLLSDRLGDPVTLHQLVDHQRLVAAVTKSSETLTPAGVTSTVRRALERTLAAPQGPVHLDLSAETASAEAEPPARGPAGEADAPPPDPDPDLVEAAARLLGGSTRPVALVGLGARTPDVTAELRALVEAFGVPVLCTYKAKGVLPDDHELAHGLVTNGALESATLDRADALLLVGFDRVELMPGPWRWQLPSVGIAEPAAGRGPLEATVEVGGDGAAALAALRARLEVDGWKAGWPPAAGARLGAPDRASEADGISPATVVAICRRLAPGGAVATVDAGSHMFAATLYWTASSPRRFLISNGLATMGYGLPAAIGAALCQDEVVICFTGDGGLAMCAGELATAARLGVRVVVVVFNDGMLNLIKVKQEKQGRTTYGLDFEAVDWAATAAGMGLLTASVSDRDGLTDAFSAALASGGPALIDVRIDATVYGDLLRLVRG